MACVDADIAMVEQLKMTAESHSFRLPLPRQVSDDDRDLHTLAAGIFRAANVRSVTVEPGRSAAIVRLSAGPPASAQLTNESLQLAANQDIAGADADAPSIELMSWIDPRDQSMSFVRVPERVRGWRKALYLSLAGAALSLGLLGIVLPVLPTTPFVLLGSFLLVRSSRTLHERLMGSRLFGGVLRDWQLHRGLRPHMRMRAIAVVAIVVAGSMLLAQPPWPAVAIILLLAAIGLTVIWRLPRVRE